MSRKFTKIVKPFYKKNNKHLAQRDDDVALVSYFALYKYVVLFLSVTHLRFGCLNKYIFIFDFSFFMNGGIV